MIARRWISIHRFVRRPHASLSSLTRSAVNVPSVVIVPLTVPMTMASLSIRPLHRDSVPGLRYRHRDRVRPGSLPFSHAEIRNGSN